jgi:hypothetical protein
MKWIERNGWQVDAIKQLGLKNNEELEVSELNESMNSLMPLG